MNRWPKSIVSWRIGNSLYLSIVFSWQVSGAIRLARSFQCRSGGRVFVGGPAAVVQRERFAGIAEVGEECEVVEPLLMHNPLASFTTRGCVRSCPWCIVPQTEGAFRELWPFRPAPIICDNNFLAASFQHQVRVVDALRQFPAVDFNQGLDARLFTPERAENLSRLKLTARFAFDRSSQESYVADAIQLCRQRTTNDIRIYVLIGFQDNPDDALYRLGLVERWHALPCPMRYQPIDTPEKDCFVAPGWTDKELRRMMRFWWKRRFWPNLTYKDFCPEPDLPLLEHQTGKEKEL